MSVRKYIRQSEGHYEKVCLPPEGEKYPSKSHQSSMQNDMLLSKERNSPRSSNNGSSSRRSDYSSSSHNKTIAKTLYQNSAQRQRDNGSPSNDRSSSSMHSRHSKSHNNNDDDNFEWTTHISSSGKTYYYNKRSEKSQWEKPKEWIERENKMRAREREKRLRETSSRDSRESSKYPKISPFKKEYISSRNSPYSKRNNEYAEMEKSRPVQTYGSSTSAVSTTSSRSSGCPTPETIGSPIGSVQDISPPSTPSNSTISSLSPFINSSSTGNNVTSPQLFTNSSGPYSVSQTNITSPYLSSPLSSRTYQNKYPYGDGKILPGTPNSHGSLGSSLGVHSTPQSSCISPVVATSAAALHPLQQAMLLQQQQIVAQQSAYASPTVSHLSQSSYAPVQVDVKRRSDAGPPPPPPQTATPPPPPPPHQLDGSPMTAGAYNSARYRDPRTTNNKIAYMSPYDSSYPMMSSDNGAWDVASQKPKTNEKPLPELADLTSFSQLCCKQTFDDVAGWMGCILERQAAVVCNEVDSCLGIASERTKSNLMVTNLTSCIANTRHQVVSSRLSCVGEVLEQVECLQDLRIERQDSKGRRSDSQSDRSDSKNAQSDARAARRDSSKS